MQETLTLSSIPGMLESILEGMAAPESALSEPLAGELASASPS
jgi:hypothetical protein